MINVFYNYYQGGPRKVVDNLIKGLIESQIEVSKNQKKFENFLYLSADSNINIENTEKTILGPNIWFEDKIALEQNYKYFLVPSVWVRDLIINNTPINVDKVLIWQVGIDTDYFTDTISTDKDLDCFIYFKNREYVELQVLQNFLLGRNLKFDTIYYGQYREDEFKSLISRSRFCIVLDNTESQGIAIQEIMSSNLPLFVWDKTFWSNVKYTCKATSVPYWTDECGVIFYDQSELQDKFEYFINNLKKFNPRKYVLNELNLSAQAKKLINLF